MFWHSPINFHSASCPMTKSAESMIYLFSFLINSLHLHTHLLFFFLFLSFSFWSFLPFPWRVRGMFLCCKMAARLMSFVQSALTFICPSITLSKGYEMQQKISKLFTEALKQQEHSEKHCGAIAVWSSTSFSKGPNNCALQHFYFVRKIVKLANNFNNLPLSSLVTYQQLLCE